MLMHCGKNNAQNTNTILLIFTAFFSRTMRLMGAEYEITDKKDADGVIRSHIKILDTTRLEKRLSRSTQEHITESSVHVES
jgi:hypothetical protein